jgi:hypothetical protein
MSLRANAAPSRIRPKRQYAGALARPTAVAWRDRLRVHKIVGVALLTISATMVVAHQSEHSGAFNVFPGDLDHLLLGFPMAGVLGIAGFVALIWR